MVRSVGTHPNVAKGETLRMGHPRSLIMGWWWLALLHNLNGIPSNH